MDELKSFIETNRDKLNLRDIEKACEMPKTTIHHWLSGRRRLPDHWRHGVNQYVVRLQKSLKKYVEKNLDVSKS